MRKVLPSATSQTIKFDAVDETGAAVVLAYNSAGLAISVKTTVNGRSTLVPLTLVARDVSGTWKSSAIENIGGTSEHHVDVPNSFFAIAEGTITLAIVSPDVICAPAETFEIDVVAGKMTGITSLAQSFEETNEAIEAIPTDHVISVVVPTATSRNAQIPDLITIVTHNAFRQTITDMGDLTANEDIWFTLKSSPTDTDDQALIQVSRTSGLIRVAGAAASSTLLGSITVVGDATDGNISVFVDETINALLTPVQDRFHNAYWDAKKKVSSDTSAPRGGRCEIVAGITRRNS